MYFYFIWEGKDTRISDRTKTNFCHTPSKKRKTNPKIETLKMALYVHRYQQRCPCHKWIWIMFLCKISDHNLFSFMTLARHYITDGDKISEGFQLTGEQDGLGEDLFKMRKWVFIRQFSKQTTLWKDMKMDRYRTFFVVSRSNNQMYGSNLKRNQNYEMF